MVRNRCTLGYSSNKIRKTQNEHLNFTKEEYGQTNSLLIVLTFLGFFFQFLENYEHSSFNKFMLRYSKIVQSDAKTSTRF